jgi:hypothetical protein
MKIYCKCDFCDLFKKGEIYYYKIDNNMIFVKDFEVNRDWHFKKNKEDSDDTYFNSYIYDYFYTPDEIRLLKLESL